HCKRIQIQEKWRYREQCRAAADWREAGRERDEPRKLASIRFTHSQDTDELGKKAWYNERGSEYDRYSAHSICVVEHSGTQRKYRCTDYGSSARLSCSRY